ncbi:MAG: carboxypeptidase-like regulatory domain-containing protein [Gammaproteobacteria bacterium]|nr:carboxypeptidase-like regulatory domain-containing protein [Gammaproteobacteria bacterium]MDH5729362.1 carboxypeptidase-like regulatory domain-containing protein [Gammaproteobacteria bacterium]
MMFKEHKSTLVITMLCLLTLLVGCSSKIAGTVKLVDKHMQPIPNDMPNGIVVNMINTTAALENASHSVKTDELGAFKSVGGKLLPGIYKVEVSRIGYKSATQTIEVKKYRTAKLDLFLRKISEGSRKSIRKSTSDSNKIINPGEVNIQPPSM